MVVKMQGSQTIMLANIFIFQFEMVVKMQGSQTGSCRVSDIPEFETAIV
jgi:hypothetical protein